MHVKITPAIASTIAITLKDGTVKSFEGVTRISVSPFFSFERAEAGVVNLEASSDDDSVTHSKGTVYVSGANGKLSLRAADKAVVPKIEQKPASPATPPKTPAQK